MTLQIAVEGAPDVSTVITGTQTMSLAEKWSKFLEHEKLTPDRVMGVNVGRVIYLCNELARQGPPKFKPYAKRIETRRLICRTAIEMNFDLAAIKYHGKIAMGRGLLDVWMEEYATKFGSAYGTQAWRETKRRDVKTKLR